MKARRPRMRTGILTVLTASVLSLAIGSPAFALSINFTDGSWNAAQGLTTFTTHPSNIDLSAAGGFLTVNYIGGPSGDNSGNDGLGINDDEITQGGSERLSIAFSTPVTLQSVSFTDLFRHEGPNGQPEVGKYSLNGGAFTSFASVGGANGAGTLNISQSGISSIVFKASNDSWSDFSIKGLTYQTRSVPVPLTLPLRDRRLLILLTPFSEPKGSARDGCETFSSHSNKNEWRPEARTRRREQSGSTKVELRCRSVIGGGGKATTTKT